MKRAMVVAMLFTCASLTFGQGDETVAAEDSVVLFEDFSEGMDNWWVEGGERVWVEDGHLRVAADPAEGVEAPGVATVWCRQEIGGDVKIEFDAHVISSSIAANNINFFMFYSDPDGTPLYDTREDRADAGYGKYHVLNGNIITFLNDRHGEASGADDADDSKARVRIRHCPGFELLAEAFGYHCRQGVTYHVEIVRRGTQILFSVDGKLTLGIEDPDTPERGLIGLRTFRTDLWWDNIKVTAL